MGLKRTSEPGSFPLSLDEVKDHLRIESTDHDSYLAALIATVTDQCEQWFGRSFITQSYTFKRTRWEVEFRLPKPPFIALTSFSYIDKDGNSTNLVLDTDYKIDTSGTSAIVYMLSDFDYPELHEDTRTPITVVYESGYGAAADVPSMFKHYMLVIVGNLYLQRESIVVGTVVAQVQKMLSALCPNKRIINFI